MLSYRLDGNMAERAQLSLIPVAKTTFRIPKEMHRRLKIRAIQEGRQMADIVVDAIETYLSSRRAASADALRRR
jgi:predicted DNA-binding protein